MRFPFNNQELFIDDRLATQLNSVAYNVVKDWDVVIIISGDRTVRVGKSVLGMTVCAYLSFAMKNFGINTKYDLDHLFFDNEKMLKSAIHMPKYSIVQYDEGREGLAASKHMLKVQQDLLDFFAECGQLNHIFVVVLPDFFQLKEEIGVPRSEFLLNVYRVNTPLQVKDKVGNKMVVVRWDRGQYQFFSRGKKAQLFDKARRTKSKFYDKKLHNFVGRFNHQYPFDEESYRTKKMDALQRFLDKKKSEVRKDTAFRDQWIFNQHLKGVPAKEIVVLLENHFKVALSLRTLYGIIQKYNEAAGIKPAVPPLEAPVPVCV